MPKVCARPSTLLPAGPPWTERPSFRITLHCSHPAWRLCREMRHDGSGRSWSPNLSKIPGQWWLNFPSSATRGISRRLSSCMTSVTPPLWLRHRMAALPSSPGPHLKTSCTPIDSSRFCAEFRWRWSFSIPRKHHRESSRASARRIPRMRWPDDRLPGRACWHGD